MSVKNTERKPFHFTAAAYVVSEKKVLLVFHKKLRKWLPAGGHIMTDKDGRFIESPEEAAMREVREETGFDVETYGKNYRDYDTNHEMLIIPESMHVHPIDEEHDHLGFDYFCRIKGRQAEVNKQEKYKWFSEEELENYPHDARPELPDHVRAMGVKAIKELSRL